MPRAAGIILWLCLLAIFAALRIDNSTRTYFQVDDQVVVWLVDDAVNNGNWQPDWYRAAQQASRAEYYATESARTDLPHAHHYNFSMHMLLSAALIKPLRLLGITTPTITLLHHIAFAWDCASLLFLSLAARRLGGSSLALCSAILYTVFPLAVQGSHYARPDALLTAMGSATLWLALEKPHIARWRWLLLNGLVLGAAVGGKASQLMLGIFPALASSAALFDYRSPRIRTASKIMLDGVCMLALIALVLALMFVAGNMHPYDFWISVLSVQQYYQHPAPPELMEHYSYTVQLENIARYFLATLGWPLLLAMLAGVVALARRADKLPLLLLTLPLLLFVLYFASVPAFFDRSFCPLAAAMVLLAAVGIQATANAIASLPAKPVLVVALAVLASWKPVTIQYHLQTDHLRAHRNDDRLAFQQQLKKNLSEKTGKDYWLKNIDRNELFSQSLPEKPPKNPRIYVVEDLNDWNSRVYLQKLRDNGFVQIAEYRGDFADMPTNSLITVHEAARFLYFTRVDGE